MGVNVLQRIPSNLLQELGRWKHGTGIQPTGHVVTADMVKERLLRNGKDYVLQFFQVMNTGYFLQCIRVTENKISETKIIRHDLAQVYIHLLGILIHETGTIPGSIHLVVHLGRLQNKRNKRIPGTYLRQQFDTCHRIHHTTARITGVRNHT